MKSDDELIGEYLSRARKLRGFSQEDVLNYLMTKNVYCTPRIISNVERGVLPIGTGLVKEWCRFLGVESDQILFLRQKAWIGNINK